MNVGFWAAILLSTLTGVFLLRIIVAEPDEKNMNPSVIAMLGAGIGTGLTSCVYFLLMMTALTDFVLLIDALLCVIVGALFFYRRNALGIGSGELPAINPSHKEGLRQLMKTASIGAILKIFRGQNFLNAGETVSRGFHAKTGFEKVLIAVFCVEAAAFVAAFIFAFLKEPHGRWDAWLIWNMHARFLFRAGEAWQGVFSVPMDWSHWDYPLLLPLSIVRSWKYASAEDIYAPALFAALFVLLTAGLLLGSVSSLRSRLAGIPAAMILLGTPFLILMGISQFADVPFSFFVLATAFLLFSAQRREGEASRLFMLAGITASLAAWVKNEGLLFFLVVALTIAVSGALKRGLKETTAKLAWFLAGAAPVMLVVITFKIGLAPPNDLTEGFRLGEAAWAKLADWSRYATIAKAFFVTALNFTAGPVDLRAGLMKINPGLVNIFLPVAWLFFIGFCPDKKERGAAATLGALLSLMVGGYFFVYLLTPLPLEYHIATSLNRLFLQLWPATIFLFFVLSGDPKISWEAQAKGPTVGGHSGAKRKRKQKSNRSGKSNRPGQLNDPLHF